jgi:hypothetical protein
MGVSAQAAGWVRARRTLRGDFTAQLYPRLDKFELICACDLDSTRKAAGNERYGWRNKVWRG